MAKLRKFWAWKARRGEGLTESAGPDTPPQTVVLVTGSEKLNPSRTVEVLASVFPTSYPYGFGVIVQKGEGLRLLVSFARDSPPPAAAVTDVYRASRDLFLAQRFVRQASPRAA